MSTENKIGRFMRNTGPLRFLLPVSIIFIVIGVLITITSSKSGPYIETTGTVTNCESVIDIDDSMTYDVSFTYIVDGLTYNGSFNNNKKYNVGDSIKVYYEEGNPTNVSYTKNMKFIGMIIIAVAVVLLIVSIVLTVKKFKKTKELDNHKLDLATIEKYNSRDLSDEITEYYFRFDGNSFKPGYILEDKNRTPIYEAINTKNIIALPREFEFVNHYTLKTKVHKITRPVTSSYDYELFSTTSYIKIDGENVWDYLHKAGIRIETDLSSSFPKMKYYIKLLDERIATVETSSRFVHEEDEAEHKIKIPYGKLYYRIWTRELDMELVFLTVFAISETEQLVVE